MRGKSIEHRSLIAYSFRQLRTIAPSKLHPDSFYCARAECLLWLLKQNPERTAKGLLVDRTKGWSRPFLESEYASYKLCYRMAPNIKHDRSNDTIISEQESPSSLPVSNDSHNHPSNNMKATQSSITDESPRQRQRTATAESPQRRVLQSYIPDNLRRIVIPYHGDFCVSPVFHPDVVCQLMAEGFLPIATQCLLLPKLHQHRCVIHLPNDLRISKSARKKSKRYRPSFNQALDRVVEGCRQQHGVNCWLLPQLVEAFALIHQNGPQGMLTHVYDSSSSVERLCPVRLYSMELWDDDSGHLVAGELGYTVGSIYTSLTGFTTQDSAGSVQLLVLGRILSRCGFKLWDLGMDMAYKQTLGSTLMPREEFVSFVHRVRIEDAHLTLPDLRMDPTLVCRDLIDGSGPIISSS